MASNISPKQWDESDVKAWLIGIGFSSEIADFISRDIGASVTDPTHFNTTMIAAGVSPLDVSKHWKTLSNLMTLADKKEVITGQYEGYDGMIVGKLSVEICFLVDCTGSMDPWIKMVKDKINLISNTIYSELPYQPKLAFVGYRDVNDAEPIIVKDFAVNVSTFRSNIEAITANGGDDIPEFVEKGLNEVTKLSGWANGTKVLFHFADAPCHGILFHSGDIKDDFPNGVPVDHQYGTGVEIRQIFANLSNMGIKYFFFRLCSHTDIMIAKYDEIMKDVSNGKDGVITVDVLNDVDKAVKNIIDVTLNVASIGTGMRIETMYLEEPNWSLIEPIRVRLEAAMSSGSTNDRYIKMSHKPFAHGSTRFAYYGYYVDDNGSLGKKIVVKRWKNISPEKTLARCNEQYKCHFLAQEVFAFVPKFVDLYRQIYEKAGLRSIGCRLASIYELISIAKEFEHINISNMDIIDIKEGPLAGYYATVEDFIPGEYVKYSNNTGYIGDINNSVTEVAQMFSHYSILWSKIFSEDRSGVTDTSLVCDIQGVGLKWTDPAVHSLKYNSYGSTNLMKAGINCFIRSHNRHTFRCCDVYGRLRELS